MLPPVRVILGVLIGYALGSLSPAFLPERSAAGAEGESGPRAAPAEGARSLRLRLAALGDALKGIAAVLIARLALAVPEPWAAAAGYAAVIGHIFPCYRRFRGGRGTAAALGLLLFYCGLYIARGLLFYGSVLAVAAVAVLLFVSSRSAQPAALVSFAFLGIIAALELGPTAAGLVFSLPAWFLFGLSLADCLRQGVFRLGSEKDLKWWRVIARPFALLFIPIDRLFHRTPLLLLLGALALIFSGMDIFRMATRYQLSHLFKKSEVKRFSSMTSFLVAIFIIFLVFPDTIPYLGLAFITLGDLFGKIVGIRYGRTGLLKGRTLEGSLAFVAGGFLAGWVLYLCLRTIPLYAVLAGPVFAAVVELFSGSLDDNFTVGIISSGFLYALRYFLAG